MSKKRGGKILRYLNIKSTISILAVAGEVKVFYNSWKDASLGVNTQIIRLCNRFREMTMELINGHLYSQNLLPGQHLFYALKAVGGKYTWLLVRLKPKDGTLVDFTPHELIAYLQTEESIWLRCRAGDPEIRNGRPGVYTILGGILHNHFTYRGESNVDYLRDKKFIKRIQYIECQTW